MKVYNTTDLFSQVQKHFAPILSHHELKKGILLHKEGELGLQLFFVKKGVLRSFYYLNGKDITSHFAFENGIIGAADSIIRGEKSRYNIEVLEDSQVSAIDYKKMEAFLEVNPHLERLARLFSQYLYIDLVERIEELTFLTAAEKYRRLTKRFPHIDQRVNLGHIASYLGLSQETLSRVRAER